MMRLSFYCVLFFTVVASCPAQGRGDGCGCRRTMSVLGDSYSTYEGYVEPEGNALWYVVENPRNDVTAVEQTWWHLLASRTGMRLERNNSFSGSTVCNTGYGGEDFSSRSFLARMNDLGCPDVILVFGLTNDDWAHAPLGDYKWGGWSKEDLYEVRPALAYMLDFMTKRYVNTEIVFILNSDLSEAINETCRKVAEHYGVPLVELHDIDKQDGHPSQLGMRQIAGQVEEMLK